MPGDRCERHAKQLRSGERGKTRENGLEVPARLGRRSVGEAGAAQLYYAGSNPPPPESLQQASYSAMQQKLSGKVMVY